MKKKKEETFLSSGARTRALDISFVILRKLYSRFVNLFLHILWRQTLKQMTETP